MECSCSAHQASTAEYWASAAATSATLASPSTAIRCAIATLSIRTFPLLNALTFTPSCNISGTSAELFIRLIQFWSCFARCCVIRMEIPFLSSRSTIVCLLPAFPPRPTVRVVVDCRRAWVSTPRTSSTLASAVVYSVQAFA